MISTRADEEEKLEFHFSISIWIIWVLYYEMNYEGLGKILIQMSYDYYYELLSYNLGVKWYTW